MHRNLGHPSVAKHMKLIEQAEIPNLPKDTRSKLTEQVQNGKTCQLGCAKPRRFLFSIKDSITGEFDWGGFDEVRWKICTLCIVYRKIISARSIYEESYCCFCLESTSMGRNWLRISFNIALTSYPEASVILKEFGRSDLGPARRSWNFHGI